AAETREPGGRRTASAGPLQARLDASAHVARLQAQSDLLNRRLSGPTVIQAYFEAPHPSETSLVRQYVEQAEPDLLGEFEAAGAGPAPIYLYDWMDDRLHMTMHDIYDWDDARNGGGQAMDDEPPQGFVPQDLGHPEAPQTLIGQEPQTQQVGPQQPHVQQPGLQQADVQDQGQPDEAPAWQWLVGTVQAGPDGGVYVDTPDRTYWLNSEEIFEPGTQIYFLWSAAWPDWAYSPQRVTPALEDQPPPQQLEPERTVPHSPIEQAAASAWVKQMKVTRKHVIQIISASTGADPESAREYLDNWNASGEGEAIALEEVGWNMGGYQAAGSQPDEPQSAPTSMTITLAGQSIEARILNDGGGYHLILEHPHRNDVIIRQRRPDATTSIGQGMANWAALGRELGRAGVGKAIRVPEVEADADAYIVEKVEGTVDALEMWNRASQLPPHSDEARMLWARLTAIRTIIQANRAAMQERRPESFPDFRPANVGFRSDRPELIYIDFDQQGEVKDEEDLLDQIRQWAGQRYAQDPGGARAVDKRFEAWLLNQG
ncbi:MAG: hypothetical protein QOJ27_2971, partial [Sphingomonadales bacterium]|nr:hypothetical protein [Sphingomonadales bacterium]